MLETEIYYVEKIDGRIAEFEKEKIKKAILKAINNCHIEVSSADLNNIIGNIENRAKESATRVGSKKELTISVSYIQTLVIDELKRFKLDKVAAHYENYKKERVRVRGLKHSVIESARRIGEETTRGNDGNANVGNNFSAKLLQIASDTNKWVNLGLMSKDMAKLHENGDLYFHDLDSYNLTTNCLHVDTEEVFARGFNTGYGWIRTPKRISSAAELSCILLQSSQNDMFGGQSHVDFDNAMSPYVEATRKEIKDEVYKEHRFRRRKWKDGLIEEKVTKAVHQAMKAVIYNLNTMHSRAGSQVPFSSLNIGLPRNKDAALVCQALLEEYNKGLGKGEQPIWPNIIFRVKDGVNKRSSDPYYYLFNLATRVCSKRMNPTFMNMDADFNLKYYEKGITPATMGCVHGREAITLEIDGERITLSFKNAWLKLSESNEIKIQDDGINEYMDLNNVNIYDTYNGKFVKCLRIIKNRDKGDWIKLSFSNHTDLIATSDHPLPVNGKGRTEVKDIIIGDKINKSFVKGEVEVISIEKLGFINGYSYDVTTESDRFDVSGIQSHNCRTYICSNINAGKFGGKEGPNKRGNGAPLTINLPRLGIMANKDINKFFELLDERLDQSIECLLHRIETLKKLKGKDLPFVIGENLLMGSEFVGPEDSIEPVLLHMSWAIGFIGVAETVKALTGYYHNQDEFARKLAYRIVKYIRDFADRKTVELGFNFGCYATPAEGLSGKFVKQDRERFGIIEGITDKEYYTNSFHVPVNESISITDKIQIEAPFHKLCNSGHITYIEFDGRPSAAEIEKILIYAYDTTNISYIGINFHLRYCKDCGKTVNEMTHKCPNCGSERIQGISRVTGYLSLDERFTYGKQFERKDRRAHNTESHSHHYINVNKPTNTN